MICLGDAAAVAALKEITERAKLMHLYINDVAMKPGVRAAEFKSPTGVGGYKPLEVQPWNVSPKQAASGVHDFYFPLAMEEPVVGWYVTDASGAFLFGERFEKPLDFSAYGGRVKVQPVLTLREGMY